ncbi:MAG: response regulator [Clostridiales Family XIII bacterium]|jgi:YesN/AraC family two-component response regulator|nr:response regulator [Clostridiales Family XIII bacterium]
MYRTLIVDDEEKNLAALEALCIWGEATGFSIAARAHDGDEALDILRAESIDLVITDIGMPGADGIDLLNRIRQQDLRCCVTLCSEREVFAYARCGIVLGALDYLKKPLREPDMLCLLRRAREAIERGKGQAAATDMGGDAGAFTFPGAPELIRRICDFVLTEPEAELGLQSVARRFSVNHTYLSNLFKQKTGIGFNEYLTRVKVERAKYYLENTDRPLWDISEQLGFTDHDYFNRLFKKHTGHTLTAYRKRVRG